MHRALAAAIVCTAVLTATTGSAFADGGGVFAQCSDDGCDLGASHQGFELGPPSSTGQPVIHCTYRPLEVPLDYVAYNLDGSPVVVDGTGQWFERICTEDGVGEVSRESVYVHPANPIELRDEARQHLVFPQLQVHLNPAREQTVNFRSLLWIAASDWAPVTATAAVPGVTVTVTATPVRVCWYMGDGPGLDEHRPCPGQAATVTCEGPGTPYDPNKSEDQQDTACSYIYRHSSSGEPGDAYQLRIKVEWSLSWSAAGAPGGGTLGTAWSTSTPTSVHVVEVQSVNTPEGGS